MTLKRLLTRKRTGLRYFLPPGGRAQGASDRGPGSPEAGEAEAAPIIAWADAA